MDDGTPGRAGRIKETFSATPSEFVSICLLFADLLLSRRKLFSWHITGKDVKTGGTKSLHKDQKCFFI